MKQKQFLKKIKTEFSNDFYSERPDDLDVYGRDWSGVLKAAPLAIAFPRSTQEVSRLLRLCMQYKIPVVPSGGRTGLSGGAVATNGELVLSLSRMNQMGPVNVLAQTLHVEAGAITQAVHDHCRGHGLTWPVDFASKGSSHVGGNIATNAGGVHVIRYGSTRSWVLGLNVVLMSGEVLELNGSLEKNNTGLDLRNLIIGSEGVLGVVTEATLKLTRIPQRLKTCFFSLKGMRQVLELFEKVRSTSFVLNAFECMDQSCYESVLRFFHAQSPFQSKKTVPAGAYVLLEVEDNAAFDSWLEDTFESGVVSDGVMAQSPREAADFWKLREGIAESVLASSEVHQHDISVGISDLEGFAADVVERYRKGYPELETFVFGHIGDGNLHVFIRKPKEMGTKEFFRYCKRSDQDLFEFVAQYRGSVSAEHGIGLLKKPALPFSRTPLELELFKKIKKAFDPLGLLNPGKMVD